MSKYQENMNKWRKLWKNQMIYYVENILSETYKNINIHYTISIHQKGHKLYVVLSYDGEYSIDSTRSSLLNFSDITNDAPSVPSSVDDKKNKTNDIYQQKLLHSENNSYSSV